MPVYTVWEESVGPLLSLGMLTAAARHHDGGRLNDHFEIRRPEPTGSFLADLAKRSGPAVLLCSDYVWSVENNLSLARRAKKLRPELVVVHGGPQVPKHAADALRFLDEHGDVADILVRGEGERVLCRLLDALAPNPSPLDPTRLRTIDGLTFRDPTSGSVVRTPDAERIADLDSLPSPYLTGEFDDIDPSWWSMRAADIETNRGCPYGCTFCDWGSLTNSRIRLFDPERVIQEVEWVGRRGIHAIQFSDANFGITSA